MFEHNSLLIKGICFTLFVIFFHCIILLVPLISLSLALILVFHLNFQWRLQDWLGLPAGVKFDPTDQELTEHLEAKVEAKNMKSHPLIDEFIPTIEEEDGICYTHPEKLPAVRYTL